MLAEPSLLLQSRAKHLQASLFLKELIFLLQEEGGGNASFLESHLEIWSSLSIWI